MKKVPPTKGSTASTAIARRQSMAMSSTLAPIIRNTDEVSEATTWETNTFTASTSEVRWVSSADGVTCWM